MAETKFKIYSLLVVKDENDVIAASLKDACRWSDKIIVIDNGSTDGTWETVQSLAKQYSQIIPWLRYEGPFHIGLRARAFSAFRHEMTSKDWWCVRLDADEFYPSDIRGFFETLPRRYRVVKKASTDYVLTAEDLTTIPFSGDFEKDRKYITHALPDKRQERRFMRHAPWLCWLERWRYPHPWGRVAPATIPVEHYQYRSPEQMKRRYETRQRAKADGCGSFKHEDGTKWQDYVMTNDELASVLHNGRNRVTVAGKTVVKTFHAPRFPNNLIYGFFRKSKAERSYQYAQLLSELTPRPISFHEDKRHGLLGESVYISELSPYPFTLRQITNNQSVISNKTTVYETLGRFTAELHRRGFFPLDYSAGNILVSEDGTQMQLVDLNRMRRYKHIGLIRGCKQFRHLHLTDEQCRLAAQAYAQARGFDPERCAQLILKYHIPI